MEMDFTKLPGEELNKIGKVINNNVSPEIAIVTPFYNGGETLRETANSIFNQTYPYFEWIIVDDGSKDEKSLEELKKIENEDSRIRVFHKKNEGPGMARDYGISKVSEKTKYVLFLDCDDLIVNTMLEHMYWTLETHKEASFTYTSMVNFGARNFYWEPYLDLKKQKKDNLINICTMVKKEDLLEVGCFGVYEKGIYEDWNLWLKLLSANKIPIRMNAPVFWYRTNDTGEFSRAKQNHARAMELINETAKGVNTKLQTIQFPRKTKETFTNNHLEDMKLPMYEKDDRKTVLFLIPWAVVGGADVFNLELLKRLDKKKYRSIVLSTLPMENPLRQEMEQYVSEYYDLSNFLDYKDYGLFVEYITKSRNVDYSFVSNTVLGYALLPIIKKTNKNVINVDYVHSIDLKDSRGGFGKISKELDDVLDITLTCNDFTRSQLIKDYGKKNVKTVYIGTDEEKYSIEHYDTEELKKEYNVPLGKKIIGFIARLSYEKRPEFFIEIAKRIVKDMKRDDYIFLIAGDGGLMNDLRSLVDKYELNNNVLFLGMMKESQKFYAMCDVTVNCSLLEGLALTSYESLSMGVPVVSADVGGQKELISDSVGKIIKLDVKEGMSDEEIYSYEVDLYKDAIVKVLNDLKKYKKNARNTILKSFTLNQMAKNIEEIFETTEPKNETATTKEIVYSYYLGTCYDFIKGLHEMYYEKVLKRVVEREEDKGRFRTIKTYFRQKGLDYGLGDRLYNIFKEIQNFYRGIMYIIYGIKQLLTFIILLIPTLFNIIYIFLKLLKRKLKRYL